jgi:IS605 OrfB family transposase
MLLALKGKITAVQRDALIQTLLKVNEASNWLSEKVVALKTCNTVKVHHAAYYELRERFGLPAAWACVVVRRVCNAYKRRKPKERFKKVIQFKNFSSVDLNKELFAFRGLDRVAITTVGHGRQVFPIEWGNYYTQRLKFVRKTAQLVYRKDLNSFFIVVYAEIEEQPTIVPTSWLGVDVGIKNVAVDSLGNFYGGEEITLRRLHYKEKRRELQKRKALKRKLGLDTRSIRRALRRISKKERNFTKTALHTVSKRIVTAAKTLSLGIALEKLGGTRERITATARRQSRYLYSCWSYHTLQQFITYKARLNGVPVVFVSPKHTSTTCPKCGYQDKKNRKSQAEFKCRQCGYEANADYVAALNLALRAQGINPCPQMPSSFNPSLG